MKKKNPDNELVTKGFLKQELKVTKGFLKSYLRQELDKFREEIDQKLTDFRDKILNAVDAVMKEVVAMRQEQTVYFHQLSLLNTCQTQWERPKTKSLLRGGPPAGGTPRMVGRASLKSFLIFFFLVTLLSPFPTFAAKKRIRVKPATKQTGAARTSAYGGASSSVRFRSDRKAIIVTLSNMENLSSVSYQLTYTANGISQGVMGKIDPSIEETATRELLFGTCSAGICTYHPNITGMRLAISSHLQSGLTVIKPYRIRP